MTPQEQLMARIEQLKAADSRTCPVVSLEEFFEGNDDYGSIGCNLDMPYDDSPSPTLPEISVATAPHPGPQGFYRILREIRTWADVQDILVEISDADVGLDWPFSECVFIMTKADREEVASWAAPLFPDTVEEGYQNGKPANAPELLPGYWVYELWWD